MLGKFHSREKLKNVLNSKKKLGRKSWSKRWSWTLGLYLGLSQSLVFAKSTVHVYISRKMYHGYALEMQLQYLRKSIIFSLFHNWCFNFQKWHCNARNSHYHPSQYCQPIFDKLNIKYSKGLSKINVDSEEEEGSVGGRRGHKKSTRINLGVSAWSTLNFALLNSNF